MAPHPVSSSGREPLDEVLPATARQILQRLLWQAVQGMHLTPQDCGLGVWFTVLMFWCFESLVSQLFYALGIKCSTPLSIPAFFVLLQSIH